MEQVALNGTISRGPFTELMGLVRSYPRLAAGLAGNQISTRWSPMRRFSLLVAARVLPKMCIVMSLSLGMTRLNDRLEWIAAERLERFRPAPPQPKDARVWIRSTCCSGTLWHASTVLDSWETLHFCRPDNYPEAYDEWLGPSGLAALVTGDQKAGKVVAGDVPGHILHLRPPSAVHKSVHGVSRVAASAIRNPSRAVAAVTPALTDDTTLTRALSTSSSMPPARAFSMRLRVQTWHPRVIVTARPTRCFSPSLRAPCSEPDVCGKRPECHRRAYV